MPTVTPMHTAKQIAAPSRIVAMRDAVPLVHRGFQRATPSAARAADDGEGDSDLIECAVSSEEPYERWFGIEILSHQPTAVDLSRLGDGRHPFLVGHSLADQVGVVKSAWVDMDKRQLRARVKFSRSARGQEIRQDVLDEVRPLISVGYFVDEVQEIKQADDGTQTVVRTFSGDEFRREMETKYGADYYRAGLAASRAEGDQPTVYLVTRWQPFEASSVPVPADASVGFDRAAGAAPAPKPAPTPDPVLSPRVEIITMTEAVKHPAELEIERRDAIVALATQYAKYLNPNDGPDAVRNGTTVDAFRELIMGRLVTKHSDAALVGMSGSEVARYSFGRALVAQMTGDWSKAGFEREASMAVAKMMGRSAEGFFVPADVWRRDFNIGTATEAGNLKPTDFRGDLFTDVLRNAMVFGRLGATYLSGLTADVDLPRKATAATVGMVTEIGSASETNPTTTKVTLAPKRLSAFVEVSKQGLIQSGIALEAMLRDDLLMSAAVKLEDQIINGAGTGAEITGLRNTTGIGTSTAGANGAAPAWSQFVDLETQCANSNAEPDQRAGYIVNTRTRGKLKQTQMGTNLPWIWQNGDQPVNGYRALVTNNLPNNLTKGTSTTVCSAALFSTDWSMHTIGLFGAPDITVDPYTKADTGQVKITLNQFADAKNRQPATVSKIEDLLSN